MTECRDEFRVPFSSISSLAKNGETEAALSALRELVTDPGLAPEDFARAGRWIAKLPSPSARPNVLILGQCHTFWLADATTAVAWADGKLVEAVTADYDNVMQCLLSEKSIETRPDVVVFLPWSRRLFSPNSSDTLEQRVRSEAAFWSGAWKIARERWRSKIVQISYDWMFPGALGHHLDGAEGGEIALVRDLNRALRERLPADSFFIDLEQVSGEMGRERFYDFRRYYWTKQPFSEEGMVRLARHCWAGIRALLYGPKKAIVVDLDGTLWGGVAGEVGATGITVGQTPDGEAYLAFQRYLKALSRRGILLAVCSKNNTDDARAPFERNPRMVLKLSDFALFDTGWNSKSSRLRALAKELQLGLGNLVFFDNEPAERDLVRKTLPEVTVVEVPTDPAEYARTLASGLWFESCSVSNVDKRRALLYAEEFERRELKSQFRSIEEYLESLDMRASVREIDDSTLPRVLELLTRTNQFNLTARRHSEAEVKEMLRSPRAIGVTLSLTDRFGDLDVVAALIGVPAGEQTEMLRIDSWVMSCRVIGRTVEEFLLREVARLAGKKGYAFLAGEYVPSANNGSVAGLFPRLGFRSLGNGPSGVVQYQLRLSDLPALRTAVMAREQNARTTS